MTKEALKLALEWYDSGREDRKEYQIMIASILAQPEQEPEPDALTVVYMSGVFEGRKLEREALIRYFADHWRSDWSDGEIIEALEARGNT